MRARRDYLSRTRAAAAYRVVMRFLALALSTIVLAACADQTSDTNDPGGTSIGKSRYEATTTVLEDADGARLCLGGVLDSLPPQCGGVPVLGWSWRDVDGEESMSGATWGDFHVVGTFDGTTFTLLDAAPPQPYPDEDGDQFTPPCPEPKGGWVDVDPAMAGDDDRIATMRVAEDIASYAGIWIGYLKEPIEHEAPGEYVVTVAFTGDPTIHEPALRTVWGGPLCLTSAQHTFADLRRAQRDLGNGGAERLGIQMTWSDVDIMDNQVELGAIVFDPTLQAALDEEYGDGVVHVEPALRPV